MSPATPHVTSVLTALGRSACWLDTVRTPAGYTGPNVGFSNASVAFCGPGYDWRYEGLLDGYYSLFLATSDAAYLTRIQEDLQAIPSAQLLNGSFRNSFFEFNPFEGGMPYEPVMLAAVCRACRNLTAASQPIPDNILGMVERYVEGYLLRSLWNKQLDAFNDWPTGDFTNFTPHATAAAVELLVEYGDLANAQTRMEHHIARAGQTLLDVQADSGILSGGLPVSSKDRSIVNPYLAARCLSALAKLATRTGEARYTSAGDRLAEFLTRNLDGNGLAPRAVCADGSVVKYPLFMGASAGTLTALKDYGHLEPDAQANALDFLLSHQSASGAFGTAIGFDDDPANGAIPDWRDVLPSCGWESMVFGLLAGLRLGRPTDGAAADVTRPVKVRGSRCIYTESAETIQIKDGKRGALYTWPKKRAWASACRLWWRKRQA